MKRAIILLFVILAAAAWVGSARGAIITIAIEGVVDYVEDPGGLLGGSISVADLITGTYTYDTSTPDTNPLVDYASYWHGTLPAGISLSIGGLEFESDPWRLDYRIGISDGYQSRDIYSVRSKSNLPVLDRVAPSDIYWELQDSRAEALSSTELPGSPPRLSDWESNILTISLERTFGIKGHVTDARIVPEPVTIVLLGFGALVYLKRR
jgi:hypothetical protein